MSNRSIVANWRSFIPRHPDLIDRIQAMAPPAMMWDVVYSMHESPKCPPAQKAFWSGLLLLLEEAMRDALGEVKGARRQQLTSVATQAGKYALLGDVGVIDPAERLMTALYWLRHAVRGGAYVVVEGSPFSTACGIIQQDVADGLTSPQFRDKWKVADASATPGIAEVQVRFEDVGLFYGALDHLLDPVAA